MNALQNQFWLTYIKDVLGVQTFLQDTDLISKSKLIQIFAENYQNYTESESELLSKMLQAIDLKMTQIQFMDVDSSECVIRFKEQPDHSSTYSPRILLLDDSKKKFAWNYLKKIKLSI